MRQAFEGAVVALAFCAHGPGGSSDIVQQFLQRDEPKIVRYSAARRLEARNERFKASGWLEACTELSPDRGFNYRVTAEGGSGLIRGRVLKKALETEREAWAKGEIEQSAIGPQNYEFQPAVDGEGESESELVKVAVTPRRKSRMLLDGAIFLARSDADLVRVEGKLASNPSFWTRRVEVTRRYERIAGVRVPVTLESVAHVRIVGRSSFRMTYRYLSVNGQEIPDARDDRCATRGAP